MTTVTASYRRYFSAAATIAGPPEISFNVICLSQVFTEFVRKKTDAMNYKWQTGDEGPEGEQKCRSTLYFTSALDGGG
jgi:hypothetical protein